MTSHVSLLTATNVESHIHLIIGSNSLAAARCGQSLAAGASPVLLAPATTELPYALQKRLDDGEIKWVKEKFQESHLFTLGREDVDHVVDAVFVTSGSREDELGSRVSSVCKRHRIPVNVVDAPRLCSFTLLSAHTDGPLQIGVTTNGRGCKLASRIRREIAALLPHNLGSACLRLGDVRRRIQEEDRLLYLGQADCGDGDDSVDQPATFNKLVTDADLDAAKNRRMRWLGQICEYWPLKRLAAITDEDIAAILQSYEAAGPPESIDKRSLSNSSNGNNGKGRIILAGSGPGHPDLLTRATHKAIQNADLILADKLVPVGVLDLIPRRTPVQIARKFPGNADAAQNELQEMAIAGVREGKTVLRLKQGDPYIYGRGGEEVEYFRNNGLGDRVVVLPGVTSALSAPLFANIPSTQRDIADQVLICTGTGKKGKPPVPPEYTPTRTVVFLMALHRIEGLIRELTEYLETEDIPQKEGPDPNTIQAADPTPRQRALWPRSTPCAVIERASCPDQRVIRTTMAAVAEAIEQEGSRPPGLLVVGRACEFLNKLESGRAWSVEDGFDGLDIINGIDLGTT
ncbi:uroporphyrin-III C-methyltransferase [Xylaria cf. heliscus]|nr:uroporphyrin-III C-methyltransferase [Xylaria cf. heliscus]